MSDGMKTTRTHHLKCWMDHFQSIWAGWKKFELRKDDRGFEDGDMLVLHEWDKERERYTGRVIQCVVMSLLRDFDGLAPGYCIMSISVIGKGI